MVADHDSPSSRSSFDASDSNARKRVCKACDRCRLKKSKCDGSSPCSRCKADNAICQFGERKKSHDKVYPKGYVELLEQHFAQLTAGLRVLYQKVQNGEEWPGEPLALQRDGHPLTHDILQRLEVLQASADCSIPFDGFEETPEGVLQALNRRSIQDGSRTNSLSPVSDEPPSPPQHRMVFQDPFAHRDAKRSRSNNYPTQPFAAPTNLNTKSFGTLSQEPMIVDSPMEDGLMGNFTSFSSVGVDFSPLQNMNAMPFLDTNFTFTTQPHWQQSAPVPAAPAPAPAPAPVTAEQLINWDSWLATA